MSWLNPNRGNGHHPHHGRPVVVGTIRSRRVLWATAVVVALLVLGLWLGAVTTTTTAPVPTTGSTLVGRSSYMSGTRIERPESWISVHGTDRSTPPAASTPSSVSTLEQWAEPRWRSYVAQRSMFIGRLGWAALLDRPWSRFEPHFPWDLYLPMWPCPTREWVGRPSEGGKWLCNMAHLASLGERCVVYSFGVRRDSSFEEAVAARTQCTLHVYDWSVAAMPTVEARVHPRIHFHRMFLGPTDEMRPHGSMGGRVADSLWALAVGGGGGSGGASKAPYRTLRTLMQTQGVQHINLLKMDVEGWEWPLLYQWAADGLALPFDQLLVEMHLADGGQGRAAIWDLVHAMRVLDEAGFRPFANQINLNPCLSSGVPSVVEYSFVHRSYPLLEPGDRFTMATASDTGDS